MAGVEVKTSSILGAGMGLFATREFKKGSTVTRYSGEISESQPVGDYVLQINGHTYLDASKCTTYPGRYVNAASGGRVVNVRYSRTRCVYRTPRGVPYVSIFATRRILPGDEILISYGPGYWS